MSKWCSCIECVPDHPEPPAQAGSEVVEYQLRHLAVGTGDWYSVSRERFAEAPDVEFEKRKLITLQSHREAMEREGWQHLSIVKAHREAIAKKDAALRACTDASARIGKYGAIEPICAFNHKEWRRDIGKLRDAINQAKDAL